MGEGKEKGKWLEKGKIVTPLKNLKRKPPQEQEKNPPEELPGQDLAPNPPEELPPQDLAA